MRMRDIAKAVGVSTMTVSRALRADASVAPATREAILQAVQDLGYVPDLAAGGLSSRRSRFVAILVPSLNNPHFSETVLGLSKRLDEAGLQLLIGDTDYRREREEALVHAFLSRKPEAIVLTPDGHTPRTLRLLADAGIPVIEIWEEPEQPVQHVVGFSNRRAMRALVESLAASGYRRMTFVGESDDEGTRGAARRSGYRDAIEALGLGPPRLCALGRPPVTMSDGERALDLVLGHFPDTDLVVCVSDPLAFGVASACRRRGIAVPEDLGIAGFGDFEISRVAAPSLTTAGVDPEEIADRLAKLIVEIHDAEPDPRAKRHISVPVRTYRRESSKPQAEGPEVLLGY